MPHPPPELNMKALSCAAMATQTHNGEGSPNYTTEIRPWSDLPEDVLVLVIKRLLICDRIRFRAVCKGWRLPVDIIQGLFFPVPKLPWTMEYIWRKTTDSNRTLSICKLLEPDLHRRPRSYIVETGMIEGRSDFVDAEACASRDGWVLFSKEVKGSLLFFLFSPFNKQVVSLPRLESDIFDIATFSSSPNSPDCIVFVAHPPESGKICISVYRPCGDDNTWNSYVFDLPGYFDSVESVAYMNGSFYCYFGCFFRLTCFKIANQEWQIIRIKSLPTYQNVIVNDDASVFTFTSPNYLLECDGELLLACPAIDTERHNQDCFFLFRLDWQHKAWGRKNALGGGAIFLGKTSFWVSPGGETENVANRVHHHTGGSTDFFLSPIDYPLGSLEEQRKKCKICYHPCTQGLNTIWIAPPREF